MDNRKYVVELVDDWLVIGEVSRDVFCVGTIWWNGIFGLILGEDWRNGVNSSNNVVFDGFRYRGMGVEIIGYFGVRGECLGLVVVWVIWKEIREVKGE